MSLRDQAFQRTYETGGSDFAGDFYGPCLRASVLFCQAAGFFRSSLLRVMGSDLTTFVKRGGKIRLIVSPDLTPEDIKDLEEGYAKRNLVDTSVVESAIRRELFAMGSGDVMTPLALNLAWLVKNEKLDVKIAVPLKDGRYVHGLYHEKLGYFQDEAGDVVAFSGSHNATAQALQQNYESMWTYTTWNEPLYANDARDIVEKFSTRWENQKPGLLVLPFPEAPKRWLVSRAPKELVIDPEIQQAEVTTPKLWKVQLLAIDAWRSNGGHGILAMATGTGKTMAALHAVGDDVRTGHAVLVCVPTHVLQDQWSVEVRKVFPAATILLVPGHESRWRRPGVLEQWLGDRQDRPSFIIATTDTIVRPENLRRLRKIAPESHFAFVADEVHHIGSKIRSSIMTVEVEHRLGLSATPIREYDEEGSEKILSYFGGIVYEYPLSEAVGHELCEYEYYPGEVPLTAAESALYVRLSARIAKATTALAVACGVPGETNVLRLQSLGERTGNQSLATALMRLIVRRADVSKKAENKIAYAVDELKKHPELKRVLVYCDDREQSNALSRALEEDGVAHTRYEGGMGESERRAAARLLETGVARCVLSMRCLDEGVDFPSVDGAMILASSKTRREFVQRRGRVLRRFPRKAYAVIIDPIVVPPREDSPSTPTPGFRDLVRDEARRAFVFAASARNKAVAESEILRIVAQFGVSRYEVEGNAN